MSLLGDLFRESRSRPDRLTIRDDQVIELADALGALTYNGRNSMTVEQVIRSGNAQLFGCPLRVADRTPQEVYI